MYDGEYSKWDTEIDTRGFLPYGLPTLFGF